MPSLTNHALASAAELSARALSPGLIAQVRAYGRDDLSFDYLGVPETARGHGVADAAVAVVCAAADVGGASVWMQPDSGFGSDLHRLIPWYARHGFMPVLNMKPFTMRRLPRMTVETNYLTDRSIRD